MPQAFVTSPKRSQDEHLATGNKKSSPKSRRSTRSSRLTSPVPLSPKDIAEYVLERGNDATSPIIAKMILDKHLDGRALAEFAEDSDTEDRYTSLSVLGDEQLADDFLRTTSSLRQMLPPSQTSRSTRLSLMEITMLLESSDGPALSPTSTAPAFMTPPLSPSIPEWDLEDPTASEDMEVFAPFQSSSDDDEEDVLFSPVLRNFMISESPPPESARGAYSTLLRPIPPYTPETMPLLSALDMPRALYGYSPGSSQGGAVGFGDLPGRSQGDLPIRQGAPGDVREGGAQPQTSKAFDLSATRVSRTSSIKSTIGEDGASRERLSRPSSCPPRATRPHIVIPTLSWQPPVRSQRQMADAEIQTEPPEAVIPQADLVDFNSDTEDVAFYDAKDSHSVTSSVRDTDYDTDDFHEPPQHVDDEPISAPNTPRPSAKQIMSVGFPAPPTAPSPLSLPPSTPAPSTESLAPPAPVPPPAPSLASPTAATSQVLRLKADSSASAAPPLTRTASEPKRNPVNKPPSRPPVDIKRAQSYQTNAKSQPPRSAPALTVQSSHFNSKATKTDRASKKVKGPTPKNGASPSRAPVDNAVKREAETKEVPSRAATTESPPAPTQTQESGSSDGTQVDAAPAMAHPAVDTAEPPLEGRDHHDHDSEVVQKDSVAPSENKGSTPATPEETVAGPAVANSKPIIEPTEVTAKSTELTQDVPASTDVVNTPEPLATVSEGKELSKPQQSDLSAAAGPMNKPSGDDEPSINDVSTPRARIVEHQVLAAKSSDAGANVSEATPKLEQNGQELLDLALSSSVLPDSSPTTNPSKPSSSSNEFNEESTPQPDTTSSSTDESRNVDVSSPAPATVAQSEESKMVEIPSTPATSVATSSEVVGPSSRAATAGSTVKVAADVSPNVAASVDSELETEGFTQVEPHNAAELFENVKTSDVPSIDGLEHEGDTPGAWDTFDAACIDGQEPKEAAPAGTTNEEQGQSSPDPDPELVQQGDLSDSGAQGTKAVGEGAEPSDSDAQSRPTEDVVPVSSKGKSTAAIPSLKIDPQEKSGASAPVSPVVNKHISAASTFTREMSQATDSQTESGLDTGAEGPDDESIAEGASLTAAEKKRLKKKAAKQKKKEEGAANRAGVTKAKDGAGATRSAQSTKKQEEEAAKSKRDEAAKKLEEEEAKRRWDETAKAKAKEEEEAAKLAKEEAQRRLDEAAKAKEEEAARAEAVREVAEKARREAEERDQRMAAEAETSSMHRQEQSLRLKRMQTQETGMRRSPDLEKQNLLRPVQRRIPDQQSVSSSSQRSASPASTTSKDSGSPWTMTKGLFSHLKESARSW